MGQDNSNRRINPHISIDCVLFGYDGEELKVLLVQQVNRQGGQPAERMKLPGSLIYDDEDLDEAVRRVLYELTGLKNINMMQFQAFGSIDRTGNPKDISWLERFHSLNTSIERIVTIAYIAWVKIDKRLKQLTLQYHACWLPLEEVGELAFDHNQIISAAILKLQKYVESSPSILYDLLPHKFTMYQIRHLQERIFNKEFDPRNFHKKMLQMDYIIPLNEYEKDVSHRAARYYKFDRKIYNRNIHSVF